MKIQKPWRGKINVTVRLTPEQSRIFEQAAILNGFRDRHWRSNYLLYLLMRDLTPVPGKLEYTKGQLCHQLMDECVRAKVTAFRFGPVKEGHLAD